MSPRLASIPLLLLLTASCGMSSSDASAIDRGDGGAAGATSGAGGNDEAGTGGGAGTVGVVGGSAGAGTAGAGGTAGSGQAGTSDPGQGGAGGGAGSGNPSPGAICTADTDADRVTECEDDPEACGDQACLRPSPLDLNAVCAVSLVGRPGDVQPWCAQVAVAGPTAALAYTAPDKGWLRVEATSLQDVILSATTGACGATDGLCLNQFGPGGLERLRLPVDKGQTVTVLVTAATASQDSLPLVSLRTVLERPACGDGKVEGDEVCDDKNTLDGDFCSADCLQITGCDDAEALPDDVEVPGPAQASVGHGPLGASADALGSCVTVGAKVRRKIHALRAESTGRLEVELAPGSARDLALSVRASCGGGAELGCSDGRGAVAGAEGQERLSLPAVKGETYLLVVEGYGDEPGDYELRAQSLPAECGDGVVASTVEQCDPAAPGGPCSDQCTRPVDGADAAAAVVLGPGGARARVWPAGDVDEYVVTVAGESFVVVDQPGDPDDCAQGRLDSQVTVLNDQGQVIAFNDDAPAGGKVGGRCSEARLPQAGTYTVRVRSSEQAAPAQVFSYWLRVVGAG